MGSSRKSVAVGIALAALTGAAMVAAAVTVPEWLAPKLVKLTPAQRSFVLSEKGMGARMDLLKKRFGNKSPEEVAAYVEATMQVQEQ